MVREALKAHEYCRLKGFAFDLVILNEFGNGYRQEVQDQIAALIDASPSASWRDTPGGVFLRRSDALTPEDVGDAARLARAVLATSSGSLAHQLEMPGRASALASATEGTAPATWNAAAPPAGADGRQVPSGRGARQRVGGFSPDGREYVASAVGGEPADAGALVERAGQCDASAAWSPRPGPAAPGSTTASRAG